MLLLASEVLTPSLDGRSEMRRQLGLFRGGRQRQFPRPRTRSAVRRRSSATGEEGGTTTAAARAGIPSEVAERLKALERENRELRQTEILRKASAYFA